MINQLDRWSCPVSDTDPRRMTHGRGALRTITGFCRELILPSPLLHRVPHRLTDKRRRAAVGFVVVAAEAQRAFQDQFLVLKINHLDQAILHQRAHLQDAAIDHNPRRCAVRQR